jgi:uncharacterized membrane protein YfcA
LLIAHADPIVFKRTIGVFLVVFPLLLYFQRKPMAIRFGGKWADAGIGFAGGILGGLAGLSGPLPILWASVRGWGKEERRGVFQTFNFTILATAVRAGRKRLVKAEIIWLVLCAFPERSPAPGSARIYHALSDRNFSDVASRCWFSPAGLLWSGIAPR